LLTIRQPLLAQIPGLNTINKCRRVNDPAEMLPVPSYKREVIVVKLRQVDVCFYPRSMQQVVTFGTPRPEFAPASDITEGTSA
jgi:hypothetical protein